MSLPPVLTVQMMRFFYKVDVRQKAKILRKVRARPRLACTHTHAHTHTHPLTRARAPAAAHTHPAALPSSSQVTFPVDLDVYDFCSDELRKELEGPRAALKEWEDEQVGRLRTIL